MKNFAQRTLTGLGGRTLEVVLQLVRNLTMGNTHIVILFVPVARKRCIDLQLHMNGYWESGSICSYADKPNRARIRGTPLTEGSLSAKPIAWNEQL